MSNYQFIDEQYKLYDSADTVLRVFLRYGKFLFNGQDFGEDVEKVYGKDEYEYFIELDIRNTQRFIYELKRKNADCEELRDILKKEFGCQEGVAKIIDFCQLYNIKYDFYAY